MRSGYICFDIETSGLIQDETPPSVLCAATMKVHVRDRLRGGLVCCKPIVWHEKDYQMMSQASLLELLQYLHEQNACGYAPLSWNGSGFDFRVLYMLLNKSQLAKELCQCHVDLCFNVFVHKGFPVKLASVALAFGCANKTDTGANAPELWAQGDDKSCLHVINYCQQDVVVLASVMSCIMSSKSVQWISKAGKRQQFRQHFDMLWPISISSRQRVVDNSWMRNGTKLDKASFLGWMKSQ